MDRDDYFVFALAAMVLVSIIMMISTFIYQQIHPPAYIGLVASDWQCVKHHDELTGKISHAVCDSYERIAK